MRNLNWERIAASSGFLFIALFIVAFFVPGEQPDLGDSNSQWAAFILDNTKELKASAILFGLAFVAFLWFAGSLAARLRDSGEQRLASVAFGSAVATAAIAFIAASIQAALAYRISAEAPVTTVKSFVDLSAAASTLIAFPVAGAVAATAIASWRSRIFPPWYGPVSGLASIVFLVAGGALAYDGFYSPDGGYPFIALAVFLVWVLVTSALLVWRIGSEEAPMAAEA